MYNVQGKELKTRAFFRSKTRIMSAAEAEGATMTRQQRIMKTTGAWCIVMGVVSIVVGVSLGVGSLVVGGNLLSGSSRES